MIFNIVINTNKISFSNERGESDVLANITNNSYKN